MLSKCAKLCLEWKDQCATLSSSPFFIFIFIKEKAMSVRVSLLNVAIGGSYSFSVHLPLCGSGVRIYNPVLLGVLGHVKKQPIVVSVLPWPGADNLSIASFRDSSPAEFSRQGRRRRKCRLVLRYTSQRAPCDTIGHLEKQLRCNPSRQHGSTHITPRERLRPHRDQLRQEHLWRAQYISS